MSNNRLPKTEEEIEAWRKEVAKANEEYRQRPRRSIRGIGAKALVTETQAPVSTEGSEST